MFNLIDTITTKDTPPNAAGILGAMLETCVDKLEAITAVQDELERIKKGETNKIDIAFIERARPVAGAVYAVEKPDEAIHGQLFIFLGLHLLRFPYHRVSASISHTSSRLSSLFDSAQEMRSTHS